MQQVDENIERYIISFVDCTCINIRQYMVKKIHRKWYTKVIHSFDKQKVYKNVFSNINLKSHRFQANSGRSLYFRAVLDKDGTFFKSDNYVLQGISFVLLNRKVYMIKKDKRILDFFGFNKKQKHTEWYLSKILDLYPML